MASALLSTAFKAGRFNLARQAVRPLATVAATQIASATRITSLKNGLTVATEANPSAQTATVGVFIDAGSRAENAKNNGAAHFLEHMAFKGTNTRGQHDLEIQIENMGAHLNAYTSREQTVYYAKSFKADIPKSVEVLSDILQNSTLDNAAIERERDVILREQQEVDKQMEEVVFDHLHATAFQGEHQVLVGAGGVDHDELVKLAEQHFSKLPVSANPAGLGKTYAFAPNFTGSEIRLQDDTMTQAHIAIAVEGCGWNSPDYYTMLVMQSIIGTWDRSLGASAHTSSRLSSIVHQNKLANSFMSFNTSYTDTGLFGIYFITENKDCQDDLIHFAQKEWARLTTSVTTAEVERAKQQLKSSLLLSLDGTTAIAEDIGRQMVTQGKRIAPQEVEKAINKITASDIAMVGIGPIECMPDYSRVRGNMSWNRF
ncbi:hypothetical protein BGZ90_000195 [Linnemannia elongata]|nr:hypothetical protein BGZ90_000195 [Linnemannia elongata]